MIFAMIKGGWRPAPALQAIGPSTIFNPIRQTLMLLLRYKKLLPLMLAMSVLIFPTPSELQRFHFRRPIMGVEFSIILYAENEEQAKNAADNAFAKIEQLDQSLSDYKSKSEINLLCRSAPHDQPVEISKGLYESIKLANVYHEQTDGAFDITIGPASRLWRISRKRNRLPEDKAIARALTQMGMKHIQIEHRNDKYFIQIDRSNMQLDFGGIAKGYAADLALKSLRNDGLSSALIDASGDIVAGDPPPGKSGWVVGAPSESGEKMPIELANRAIATSGDVYQFMEVDGVRYSHIVNPRTGIAVTESRIVTVIGKTGAASDAYASALSVLGEEGLSLGAALGFEAQVISAANRDLSELKTGRTDGFLQNLMDSNNQ